MTKITFYKGLRVIGGTFVAVETDRAVCMFDFGFTVNDRADESIRLRPGHIPQDYVRAGMLPCADGIYEPQTAADLGVVPYGETEKPHFFLLSHMHIDHILDSNVRHSAVSYKNKEDIVINIVFRKAFFNTMFLSRLSSHGIVSSFLLDVISQNRAHDRHLIFHTQNNCKIHPLVQFLLCEYFSPSVCAQELIPIYVSAIFTELINTLCHSDEFRLPEKSNVLLILKYIEQNYKTCTLQSTARYFGYNSNYLGNLLKQRTGKTFRDLKLMQQLTQAALLLVNSDESVLDIIDKVSCTNCSYFYRKFAAAYRSTPLQYRQQYGNP